MSLPVNSAFVQMTHRYTLFGVDGSGNCLKVRMLLGFLGVEYNPVAPGLKPASADLLAVNPLGQVPVLVDAHEGGLAVRDSNAILVYLCLQHGAADWYPVSSPARCSKVTEWLSFATAEINHALLWVRIKNKFSWDIPTSYEVALERGRAALLVLENHLLASQPSAWLVAGDKPTIADIAVFPYVALADSSSSGAIELAAYPQVKAWVERVKALEGMTVMPPW